MSDGLAPPRTVSGTGGRGGDEAMPCHAMSHEPCWTCTLEILIAYVSHATAELGGPASTLRTGDDSRQERRLVTQGQSEP